ncbi:hypothetical protein BLNAU_19782 [Blattamonas nauphoetae]|uniref:Uncharacterized protein n=1 Tax=Blattamonas nauphoetae TaxID=2049346 RepID=A0ABQ9X3Q4_9EUKA|nr:hypothetical protein BLNAU_19782 [Blattamonas nauphoetae]
MSAFVMTVNNKWSSITLIKGWGCGFPDFRNKISPHKKVSEYVEADSIVLVVYFGCSLPSDVYSFLESTPLFSIPPNSVIIAQSVLLNHTSISSRRNPQQAFLMELFFERILHTEIHTLFVTYNFILSNKSAAFLNSHLFGLHSLFHRGFQINLNETSDLDFQLVLWSFISFFIRTFASFQELVDLYSFYPPPNIIPFLSSAIVSRRGAVEFGYSFSVFFEHLLYSCAPFGELSMMRQLTLLRLSTVSSTCTGSAFQRHSIPPSSLSSHRENSLVEMLIDTNAVIKTFTPLLPHLVDITVTDLPKIEVIRHLHKVLLYALHLLLFLKIFESLACITPVGYRNPVGAFTRRSPRND